MRGRAACTQKRAPCNHKRCTADCVVQLAPPSVPCKALQGGRRYAFADSICVTPSITPLRYACICDSRTTRRTSSSSGSSTRSMMPYSTARQHGNRHACTDEARQGYPGQRHLVVEQGRRPKPNKQRTRRGCQASNSVPPGQKRKVAAATHPLRRD